MSLSDAFRYDGKRVLVVGGATGMGAAAAELVQDAGAEVVVMDYADVKLPGVKADPPQPGRQGLDRRRARRVRRSVHALFSCAGVADGTPGIERINFIGHRHLIDRLLAGDMLPRGLCHRLHLVGRRLGWQATWTSLRSTSTSPTSTSAARGPRSTARPTTSGASRRSAPTSPARRSPSSSRASASTPSPGPHRHAARPGQRGDLARLRRRLPRRGRHRGLDAARAGLPLVFLCSDAANAVTGMTMITDPATSVRGSRARSRPPHLPWISWRTPSSDARAPADVRVSQVQGRGTTTAVPAIITTAPWSSNVVSNVQMVALTGPALA